MAKMLTWIETWLIALGLEAGSSGLLSRIILAAGILLVSFIAFSAVRRIVRGVIHHLFSRTRFTWDDQLRKNRFVMRMTLIVPALIIQLFLPAVLSGYDQALAVVEGALKIYYIAVALLVLDALINTLYDLYTTLSVSREIPLKGSVQVLKIVLFSTGLILVLSVIIGRSPALLISGLGALTAVLMLVFKDPILGFTAGLQLTSNRMLKNGDWIEMPKYGADGDVQDISLTTVKVRNWDNTITHCCPK